MNGKTVKLQSLHVDVIDASCEVQIQYDWIINYIDMKDFNKEGFLRFFDYFKRDINSYVDYKDLNKSIRICKNLSEYAFESEDLAYLVRKLGRLMIDLNVAINKERGEY